MHAGALWVLRSAEFSPFFGEFLPLGSFGQAGYHSGLQYRSLMHPRHYQGLKDGSVPQGLLHLYWPWQVSPMRRSCVAGLLGYLWWWAGPLFLCQNWQPLSRTLLSNWHWQIMASAAISGNLSSHSFRLGAILNQVHLSYASTDELVWLSNTKWKPSRIVKAVNSTETRESVDWLQ